MLGQDAVNTAKSFHERLPLTGVILTKTDGDSRGGAALSVRHVTGKPIKFVGSGEKLDGFDAFDPEAMASRIIGMGDIVGLVKDVQKSINVAEAEKLAQKLKSGKSFDLTDFRAQLAQMGGMGSFSSLMEKLPAQFQQAAGQVNDEQVQKQLRRTMGIIDAMTPAERRKPDLIKASRKKRIAMGAGVPVQEVNRLLKQFDQTQDMMKRMQRGGLSKMMRALGGMGLPGMGKLGASPAWAASVGPVADAQSAVKRILGLDPGLNHLGWAVIETRGTRDARGRLRGLRRPEGRTPRASLFDLQTPHRLHRGIPPRLRRDRARLRERQPAEHASLGAKRAARRSPRSRSQAFPSKNSPRAKSSSASPARAAPTRRWCSAW